jgi:phytoene/squalene synthetase
MCLRIFCTGDEVLYDRLKDYSKRSLGMTFQKVNFLPDMKADHEQLDRMYFRIVISTILHLSKRNG